MADTPPQPGNWRDFPWFTWVVEPPNSGQWYVVLFMVSGVSIFDFTQAGHIIQRIRSADPLGVRDGASVPPDSQHNVVAINGRSPAHVEFLKWWDRDTFEVFDRDLYVTRVRPHWDTNSADIVVRDTKVHTERLPVDWMETVLQHLGTNRPRDLLLVVERAGLSTRRRVLRRAIRDLYPGAVDKD